MGRLGTHQIRALRFYQWLAIEQGPEAWHSFAHDSLTRRTIKSLVRANLLEVNEYHQARIKG